MSRIQEKETSFADVDEDKRR